MKQTDIRSLAFVDTLADDLKGVGYFEIQHDGKTERVDLRIPDLNEHQLLQGDLVNVLVMCERTNDEVEVVSIPSVVVCSTEEGRLKEWVTDYFLEKSEPAPAGEIRWTEKGNNLFVRGDDFCAIRIRDGMLEIINWNPDNSPQLCVTRGKDTLTRAERSASVQELCAGWEVIKNNSFDLEVEDGIITDKDDERSYSVEGVYKDNRQIFDGYIEAHHRAEVMEKAADMGLVNVQIKGLEQ